MDALIRYWTVVDAETPCEFVNVTEMLWMSEASPVIVKGCV